MQVLTMPTFPALTTDVSVSAFDSSISTNASPDGHNQHIAAAEMLL